MTLEERKRFFEEEGYLIAEGLLSADELEECRQEVDKLHRLAAELKAKGDPRGGSFQQEPYAKDAKREDGTPALRKIENTRAHSDVFRRLSEHPNVLREVKNLIGPDLLLFRSTLMLKPARHGSPHGFHQDSAYWPMEPPKLVTVSIALNDSTLENGCIRVIPKSHLWGEKLGGRIAREQHESLTDGDEIDEADAVAAPLKAGRRAVFSQPLRPWVRAEPVAPSAQYGVVRVLLAGGALHGEKRIAHFPRRFRAGRNDRKKRCMRPAETLPVLPCGDNHF